MQLYLVDCQFEDIEPKKAAYAQFIELWESGAMAKEDKFDGFELLFRVHAPGEGRVVVLCRAEGDKQLFTHFAPWRAQFWHRHGDYARDQLPERSGLPQRSFCQTRRLITSSILIKPGSTPSRTGFFVPVRATSRLLPTHSDHAVQDCRNSPRQSRQRLTKPPLRARTTAKPEFCIPTSMLIVRCTEPG